MKTRQNLPEETPPHSRPQSSEAATEKVPPSPSDVQAYGVWVKKSMYGKKYMATERSTVIIGPDGKVKAVLREVQPAEHLDLVLHALV